MVTYVHLKLALDLASQENSCAKVDLARDMKLRFALAFQQP